MLLIELANIRTKLNSARSGYVFILIAAAFTGLIHSLSKPLLSYTTPAGMELNPLTLSVIIYLVNGVFFIPIRKDSEPISKLGKRKLILIHIIVLAKFMELYSIFFVLSKHPALTF